MNLSKSILSLLCLSTVGLYAAPSSADTSSWPLAKYPLYIGSASLPPLVMILMGRDHSMFYEAYNDMTDLDDDGKIDFIFNPAVTYDGIFESNFCYSYNDNVFKINSLANTTQVKFHNKSSVVYTCDGTTYSGNFMNYLTSSRLDLVKRILIGGQRLVKTASAKGVRSQTARYNNYPYLTRQWIPHDTHVWAKIFNPGDYNLNNGENCPLGKGQCSINKWTPYGSDKAFLFGNVQRHLHAIPFTCSSSTSTDCYQDETRHPLGSLVKLSNLSGNARNNEINNNVFIWNWLARESGQGGGVGEISVSGNRVKTRYTAPGGANSSDVYADLFNLVVESCNPTKVDTENLSKRCKKYTSLYNTVGLLQQFSDTASVDAYFGLITAGWNRNGSTGQSYGVLRAPVKELFSQVDPSNGDFRDGSLFSVINNIDLKTEGASLNSGSTSANWSGCSIDSSHQLRVYQRGCADWGNPLAPLLTLSHDYFEDKIATSKGQNGSTAGETIRVRASWSGNQPPQALRQDNIQNNSGMWLPGYNYQLDSPFKMEGIYECQKPINLILLDENISLDWYGGDDTAVDSGFSIIDASEHFTGKSYILGENTTSDSASRVIDYQTLPTLKTIDNLKNVRGVSVLEPQQSGSLKGPAVAAHYYKTPLNLGDGKDYSSIQNVVVAMASYLPKFTIEAENGKSVLFIPICKTPRVNKSGNYSYTGDLNGTKQISRSMFEDDGSSYTTTCGIGDVFYVGSQYNSKGHLSGIEFRVTYEDNDGGSDFDMDVAGSYKVYPDPNDGNVLNVELTGYYSDGYAPMIMGYVIIGTEGVYEYNHNSSDGVYWNLNRNKTVYFDIMKGSNDGNRQVLFALQSDPFYDINNTTSQYDVNERLWRIGDRISQTVMQSSNSGYWPNGTGKSMGDARYCYEDKVWNWSSRYNEAPFVTMLNGTYKASLLPRVGAIGGGTPMLCSSTVKRRFKVVGTEGAFLPSPLELTAKYGFRNTSLSNYYYVTNAATLADNITAAMKATLAAGNRSSTALTFPSVEISTSDAETIIASFDTEYWTGDVKKVRLGNIESGHAVTNSQVWSASEKLSSLVPEARHVYMADAKGNLVRFTANNILAVGDYGLKRFPRMYQGIINAFELQTCTNDEIKTFIDRYSRWVLGDDTYELADDLEISPNPVLECGGTVKVQGFHKRNGNVLGTVINSTPQMLQIGGTRYVVFSANDGMVHIIKDEDGTEVMSIIPYVAQYEMPRAALRGDMTRFILDGEINVFDVYVGNSLRRIAYGSRGLTFPGIFALDLTQVNLGVDQVRMNWELSKNEEHADGTVHAFGKLGTFNSQIYVFPYGIAQSDGSMKRVLLSAFGNGYNSSAPDTYAPDNRFISTDTDTGDGISSVAVINALSGKIKATYTDPVWGLPDCNRDPEHADIYSAFKDESNAGRCFSNGMNVRLAGFDPDHDDLPDYAYSTDLYGNIYRLSMVKKDATEWTFNRIYTTVSVTGTPANPVYSVQPITTKPSLAGNSDNKPVVVVGTGKYLTAADVPNTDVQSIYAIEDTRYKTGASAILSDCSSLTCLRNKLYKSSLVALNSSEEKFKNYRDVSLPKDNAGNAIEYDSTIYSGWVIDMNYEPGERVIVEPTVQDHHVYMTSMVPTDNPCYGGGVGHMYDINVLTGYFFSSAEESQLFSKQIMSKASTAYSRPSNASSGAGTGTSTECTGKDCPRKRGGVQTNCTNVHVATQTNDQGVEVLAGPQYCPRVESWQYIFN